MRMIKIAILIFFVLQLSLSFGEDSKKDSRYIPMDLKPLKISIPLLPGFGTNAWINGNPEVLNNLKGKVVMIDFWEYTCVNCLLTMPYVNTWYNRYSDKGLVIIGVHSPEYVFGRERENIVSAVRKFGIKYPVVMDNDYIFWNIFENKYWPSKYIFDQNGILRYVSIGEGNYGNTETMIQKLLWEINSNKTLPEIMDPIRNSDRKGAVCYLITPETYLGYNRGEIGNTGGYNLDSHAKYTQPKSIEIDTFYLSGRWDAEPDYVRFTGSPGLGRVLMNYIAAEVNVVIKPENETNFKVYVYQDGKPVPLSDRGSDINVEKNGKTYILINEARMYQIIKNNIFGRHILTLESSISSFAVYEFSFVTTCKTPADLAVDNLIKI